MTKQTNEVDDDARFAEMFGGNRKCSKCGTTKNLKELEHLPGYICLDCEKKIEQSEAKEREAEAKRQAAFEFYANGQ